MKFDCCCRILNFGCDNGLNSVFVVVVNLYVSYFAKAEADEEIVEYLCLKIVEVADKMMFFLN